jgi:Iodothyronine deiodinase
MPAALKWILISLAVVLVGGFAFLSFMAGSPKDVYYMVRYAFPHMRLGNVKVGEPAPDATLVALDGATTFHIREKTGARPLVLVFGSFT